MHTEVHSESGRVLVISNIPDNQPQAFTVCIKNPADWEEMHNYIINENEIDGIPNRRIDCIAEMPFSTKRAVYQISVEEAEILRQHPKVEWVEESSTYNPTCLEQRKYDEEFDRHVDAFRFKDSNIRHKRAGGDPTPVDNSLLDFTQWGLHRHGYKNDPFGSETDVSADIKYQFTGKNVDVVIMDTGIRWDHPEFLKPGVTTFVDENSTRVRDILIHGASEYGIDWEAEGLVSPGSSPYTNYTVANVLESSTFNGSWHGSHVGGTAAGNQFGAAFEANIWSIACVDRSDVGWAEPSDGFDYIKVWHKNKPINPETGRRNPTIVNCSWGHRQFVRDDLSSSATFRGTTYTDGGDEYLGEAYDSIYFLDRNSSYFEFTTRRVSGQTTMDELLDDPDCQDIIFICSAGNSKSKQDTIGGLDYNNQFISGTFYYSSGYDAYWCRGGTPAIGHQGKPDAVISVASLSEYYSISQETLDDYTSRGPAIDIIAAGGDILCPWNSGYFDPRDFSYFINYLQGTSMAAPNVTGVVALYLQSKPDATRIDVRNWLFDHGSVLAPLIDSQPDFTNRDYWGSATALRDTIPRVLFNPYANDDTVSFGISDSSKDISITGIITSGIQMHLDGPTKFDTDLSLNNNVPSWSSINTYDEASYLNVIGGEIGGSNLSLTDGSLFTMEAWIYLLGDANAGGYGMIVTQDVGIGDFQGWQWRINDINKKQEFIYWTSSLRSSAVQIQATTSIVLNDWSHLAITYDGTNIKMYYNGSEDFSHTPSSSLYGSTSNIGIGRFSTGSFDQDFLLNGRFGAIRLYKNNYLTSDQIKLHYNLQKQRFVSGVSLSFSGINLS